MKYEVICDLLLVFSRISNQLSVIIPPNIDIQIDSIIFINIKNEHQTNKKGY